MAISGTIVNPGDVVNFSYVASIQEWVVPVDGLYMLEAWGARGGNIPSGNAGGGGGYSVGYALLTKDTILYIVTGGAGVGYASNNTNYGSISGGYNGGGLIRRYDVGGGDCATGGGATHIATRSGLLSALKNYVSYILLVAGGGGGAFGSNRQWGGAGGTGGGTTGGDGQYATSVGSGFNGRGGSQSKAGANGGSDRSTVAGGFGYGGYIASSDNGYISGGGSGYYGGGCGGSYSGAGGGSGYIGGVPEIVFNGITYTPSMTNGIWSGNGKAAITLIALAGSGCYLGDQSASIYMGDVPASYYLQL